MASASNRDNTDYRFDSITCWGSSHLALFNRLGLLSGWRIGSHPNNRRCFDADRTNMTQTYRSSVSEWDNMRHESRNSGRHSNLRETADDSLDLWRFRALIFAKGVFGLISLSFF